VGVVICLEFFWLFIGGAVVFFLFVVRVQDISLVGGFGLFIFYLRTNLVWYQLEWERERGIGVGGCV
jgi:hypothetical protein